MIISIIGGSGFVGTALCRALSAAGYQVRILTRSRTLNPILFSDHNIQIVPYQSDNTDSLSQALKHTDILINLVGIFNTRQMQKYHVEFAINLLHLCQQLKIKQLIHLSALGASNEQRSTYLRTKYAAEQQLLSLAVEYEIPVTIFKPSVIFSENDLFFAQFAELCQKLPVVFVPCAQTKFQPVYLGDLVQAILFSVNRPECFYQVFEIAGPKVYTFLDLVRYIAVLHNKKACTVQPLPKLFSLITARIMGLLPKAPFSYDQYLSLQHDNISTDNALPRLGVEVMMPLEAVLPRRFQANKNQIYDENRKFARR